MFPVSAGGSNLTHSYLTRDCAAVVVMAAVDYHPPALYHAASYYIRPGMHIAVYQCVCGIVGMQELGTTAGYYRGDSRLLLLARGNDGRGNRVGGWPVPDRVGLDRERV